MLTNISSFAVIASMAKQSSLDCRVGSASSQ